MKKIALLFVFSLYACSATNSSGPYDCVGSGRGCKPVVLQQPTNFVNVAATSNNNVTSMLARNEAQVTAYIKSRLIGLNLENATEPNYLEIAQLALWLTTASEEDINTQLETNRDNIRRAMYVFTFALNSCFADNATISVAKCFMNYKDTYSYNSALSSLETNAKVLNIENANFTSSDSNENALLQFGINDSGKIVSLSVIKGMDETTFERYNNTNEFNNTTISSTLTYDSIGKDLGLKYSDFGTYDIISETPNETRQNIPFAGGYIEKKITEPNIAQDLHFSGKAAGTVTSYKNGSDNPEIIELENGRTYLTFDSTSGDAHITSTFDNWYTVVVDKGATETINFENYKENANGYDMRMLSTVGVFADPIEAQTTTVSYYGPNPSNGIPTEATGLIQFRDCGNGIACTGNYDTTPEIKLDMGFGVH